MEGCDGGFPPAHEYSINKTDVGGEPQRQQQRGSRKLGTQAVSTFFTKGSAGAPQRRFLPDLELRLAPQQTLLLGPGQPASRQGTHYSLSLCLHLKASGPGWSAKPHPPEIWFPVFDVSTSHCGRREQCQLLLLLLETARSLTPSTES